MYCKKPGPPASLLAVLILTPLLNFGVYSRSVRKNEIPTITEPFLAAYPSPEEDGTFYIVNLSDQPEIGRSDQVEQSINFFLVTKSDLGNEEVHEIRIGEENPSWLPSFRPNATLKILCHGYKSSHQSPFPAQMKTTLLGNSVNVNVVMVGWEALAEADMVQTAVESMRYVGEKTAEMLNYIHRYSLIDIKKVHFIGHNLGAHIGGIAGASLQRLTLRKIGRITGLDPANVKNCNDTDNLLDRTDAELVDVIHTDFGNHCGENWISKGGISRHWGMKAALGHVDYYPQPIESKIFESCPHCRSYQLFANLMLKEADDSLCECDDSPDSHCKCRQR